MKTDTLVILIIIFLLALISVLIGANYKDSKNYTLDLYTDTISNNIILTTIVNNGNNIGINSIKIGETNND